MKNGLKKSEQLYRYLYEYGNEILFIYDVSTNKIASINNTFKLRLGYTKENIENLGLDNFIHADDLKDVRSKFMADNENSFFEGLQTKVISKKGQIRIMNFQSKPMNAEKGDLRLCSFIDITEELAYKHKIEAQNRTLLNKNEELEQFAFIASHDLQEPLRTASSFTDLVLQDYSNVLDNRAVDFLQRVVQSNERMRNLILSLLHYSRIGKEDTHEEINLNHLIQEILEDFEVKIQESDAMFEIDQLPRIKGSQAELRMLFQNLISNALKFQKDGVSPIVKIKFAQEESTFSIQVADNGIGIDNQWKDKIFMIFQRLHTKDQYPGTGIGLAQVQKVALTHEGEISVNSKEGQGSTFALRLSIGRLLSTK